MPQFAVSACSDYNREIPGFPPDEVVYLSVRSDLSVQSDPNLTMIGAWVNQTGPSPALPR